MVWAIVVVAIGILGVAAWAGTGRLGEMPDAVIDRPKAYVPDGPVDGVFIANLHLPTAVTGYRRSQVDTLLAAHVEGADIEPGTLFDVVRKGYDMQAVDAVIERIGAHQYPEVAMVANDEDDISAGPEGPLVNDADRVTTDESDHTSLSGPVPSRKSSDETLIGPQESELSEGDRLAVRGDSPAPRTGDAG